MPPSRLALEAFKLLVGRRVEVEAKKVACAPGWSMVVAPATLQPVLFPQRGLGSSVPMLGGQVRSASLRFGGSGSELSPTPFQGAGLRLLLCFQL